MHDGEPGEEQLVQSTTSTLPPSYDAEDDGIKTKAEEDNFICHGRIAKLEEKVPEFWWKTLFADSMYLKTDGDVVEDPDITKEEIEQLVDSIPEIRDIFLKGSTSCAEGKQCSLLVILIKAYFPILLEPGKILDLCCGQGRHSLQLANDYPHLRVYGHDQSAYLISLAQVINNFSFASLMNVA
jgi:hypothetical protein